MKYYLARIESISKKKCLIMFFLQNQEIVREAKPFLYNWLKENDLLHVNDEFGITFDGEPFKFTQEILNKIENDERIENPEYFKLYDKLVEELHDRA